MAVTLNHQNNWSILPKCPTIGAFLRPKTLAIHLLALNIVMDTNITITDLVALRNIMNMAAERGAVRADEMLEVGTLYIKLNTFLEAVIARAAAQEEAEDTAETPQGE